MSKRFGKTEPNKRSCLVLHYFFTMLYSKVHILGLHLYKDFASPSKCAIIMQAPHPCKKPVCFYELASHLMKFNDNT
jgi:hypothetical protein